MSNPHIVKSGDGSISIEWVFKDARFRINLELDAHKQSGWYYTNKDNICEFGFLPPLLENALLTAKEGTYDNLHREKGGHAG